MIHEFFQNFAGISRWWLIPIWLFCARLAAIPFWKEVIIEDNAPSGANVFRIMTWLMTGVFMFTTSLAVGEAQSTTNVGALLELWFKSMSTLGIFYLVPNMCDSKYFQNFLKVVFMWDFSIFKKAEATPPKSAEDIIAEYDKKIKEAANLK